MPRLSYLCGRGRSSGLLLPAHWHEQQDREGSGLHLRDLPYLQGIRAEPFFLLHKVFSGLPDDQVRGRRCPGYIAAIPDDGEGRARALPESPFTAKTSLNTRKKPFLQNLL